MYHYLINLYYLRFFFYVLILRFLVTQIFFIHSIFVIFIQVLNLLFVFTQFFCDNYQFFRH